MTESTSKRKKRLISALLSVSVFITVLGGCNRDNPPVETEQTTVSSGTTASTDNEATTSAEEVQQEEPVKLLENRVRNDSSIVTSIEAVSTDGKCITTDTSFKITSSEDLSADELKSRISVNYASDFQLVRESLCSYLLTNSEELPDGSIVTLEVTDENGDISNSWAFQAKEDFKIKSTYPADKSDSVYADTGIEIEFSTPVSAADAEDYFEINPPLEGEFLTHRNTLYFVPEDGMKSRTVYTVTVKKGIESTESGALEEDYSFSFRTSANSRSDYFYICNGFSETFLEGDPAVIELYCSDSLKNKEFDLKLYEFASGDEYYSVMKEYTEGDVWYDDFRVDVSGLTEVFSSCEKPQPGLVEWKPLFIMLPDNLTEGYYVADITAGELSAQYLIQVNPISVFSLSLGEENSFFINDTKTGGAAAGARVTIDIDGKTYTGVTDSDGLVNIDTGSSEAYNGVLDITYGGSRFIDQFCLSYAEEVTYDDLYYMYLYTDREAYLTTDTIKVWGIILPRRSGTAIPENLALCFGGSETAGEIKEITPAPDGTFSAEFSFSKHVEAYARLTLLDGETPIDSKSVRIKDYVKPNYVFDIALPEYAVMPHRNPIIAEITANYYEGTPAKGLFFDSSAKSCTPKILKTDDNGKTEASLLFNDHDTWRMSYTYHELTLDGVENEYTYLGKTFYSFHRDVMLDYDYDRDTRTLSVETSRMNFDKIPEFFDDGKNNYDILKESGYDTTVDVSITHYWTEKVESGTYYDFIEKRTVAAYDYISRQESLGTYTIDTINGKGSLTDLPLTDDKGSYTFVLSYNDSLGQYTEESFRITAKDYVSWWEMQSRYLNYTLKAYPDEEDYRSTFHENEAVPFTLKCNGASVDSGRIFFAAYKNDFLDETVYDTTDFSYKTDIESLPCFRYDGAYFDGRHVYPIYGSYLYFDPEDRDIALQISSDKETYDAGETVQLTVTAVDMDGKPVNGAAVSLSVVDEAAFAIAPQDVDILADIYEAVWYHSARHYYSYIQHVLDDTGAGEKGGGGEDISVRKDFKDNAYFGSQITGADGTAAFTFQLADNLTTWRATVQAVKEYETGRVLTGDDKFPIISTRPLFITPIMLSTFIEGDDIAVAAKCHGIDSTDKITVNITGDGVDETLYAMSSRTVNFGKLPKGEYKVLFTAEKNGNRDAIELPLTVTDTILEAEATNAFDLSDGIDIAPVKWPVSITFFDKEYMFYTDILRELLCYGGKRLDMRIASEFAYMELGYITEEQFAAAFISETYDGLAKLLPAGDTDAELTALMCAAAPEIITRGSVIEHFDYMVSSRDSYAEDLSIGYMGLAALGEPVLEEIKALLENHANRFDYYGKMRLTAAIALCGDYDNAYKYYLEFCPEIALIDNDPENIMAYVNCENDEIQERTKLALITASILNLPEAEYFARYLISKSPQFDSYALELMVYLRNYIPDIEGDAVFTYNLNGKTGTVELDRHRGYRMKFGEEQFNNADFTVVSGAVYAVANYEARINEQNNPKTLTVTKTMTGDFTPGGTVKVTVKVKDAYGTYPRSYNVEDVIPSCGRYVEKPYDDNCYSRSGQRVSLWTDDYGTAVYWFRIATSGEYVVESAVAQDGGEWGASSKTTITAGGDNDAV